MKLTSLKAASAALVARTVETHKRAKYASIAPSLCVPPSGRREVRPLRAPEALRPARRLRSPRSRDH